MEAYFSEKRVGDQAVVNGGFLRLQGRLERLALPVFPFYGKPVFQLLQQGIVPVDLLFCNLHGKGLRVLDIFASPFFQNEKKLCVGFLKDILKIRRVSAF